MLLSPYTPHPTPASSRVPAPSPQHLDPHPQTLGRGPGPCRRSQPVPLPSGPRADPPVGVLGAGGLHPGGRKAAEGDLQLGGKRREADAHVQRAHHAGEAQPSPARPPPSAPPRPLPAVPPQGPGPTSRPGACALPSSSRFAFTGLCRPGAASPRLAVLCSRARQAGATDEACRQSDETRRAGPLATVARLPQLQN